MLENAIVPMFLLQVMLECAALIRSIAIYVKRMRFCSNVFATHVRTCVFNMFFKIYARKMQLVQCVFGIHVRKC